MWLTCCITASLRSYYEGQFHNRRIDGAGSINIRKRAPWSWETRTRAIHPMMMVMMMSCCCDVDDDEVLMVRKIVVVGMMNHNWWFLLSISGTFFHCCCRHVLTCSTGRKPHKARSFLQTWVLCTSYMQNCLCINLYNYHFGIASAQLA